jgi:hypothetical protein
MPIVAQLDQKQADLEEAEILKMIEKLSEDEIDAELNRRLQPARKESVA